MAGKTKQQDWLRNSDAGSQWRRQPLGPRPSGWRGWLVYLAKGSLMALLAALLWPLVMILLTLVLILADGGMPLIPDGLFYVLLAPSAVTMLLSVLRLDGRWWSPWAFAAAALAAAGVFALMLIVSGGISAYGLELIPMGAVVLQAVLHGVWSLFGGAPRDPEKTGEGASE